MQIKRWSDVASSPEYQQLDTQGRNALQRQYFEQVVKPQAKGNIEHEAIAWQQFTQAYPLEGSKGALQQEIDLASQERTLKERQKVSQKVSRENEYLEMVDDAFAASDAIKGRVAQKEAERGWFDKASQSFDNFAGGAFETVADYVPFMDYSEDLDKEAREIYRMSQSADYPEYREYSNKTLDEIRSELRQQDMLEFGVNAASFIPVVRGARLIYGAGKLATGALGLGTAAGAGALTNLATEEGKALIRQEQDRGWSERGSDLTSGAIGGAIGYGAGKVLDKGMGFVGGKVKDAFSRAVDDVDVSRALKKYGYDQNALAAAEASLIGKLGTDAKLEAEDRLKSNIDSFIENRPEPKPKPQPKPQTESETDLGGVNRPYLGGGQFGDAPATGFGNRTNYIQERLAEQQRPDSWGSLVARLDAENNLGWLDNLRNSDKVKSLGFDEAEFKDYARAEYNRTFFDSAKDTVRSKKEKESAIRRTLQEKGYTSPFVVPDTSTGKLLTPKQIVDRDPTQLVSALRSLDADVATASRISNIEAAKYQKRKDTVYRKIRAMEGGKEVLDGYQATRALEDVLTNSRIVSESGKPLRGDNLKNAIANDAYYSQFEQNISKLPNSQRRSVESELLGQMFTGVDSAAAFRNVLRKQSKFISSLPKEQRKRLESLGRALENAPELAGEGVGRGLRGTVTDLIRNNIPALGIGAASTLATGGSNILVGVAGVMLPIAAKGIIRKARYSDVVLDNLEKLGKEKDPNKYVQRLSNLVKYVGKQAKKPLGSSVAMGTLGANALSEDNE